MIAGSDLRDIYVEFKANNGGGGAFSCEVKCVARGDVVARGLKSTREEVVDAKCCEFF